MALSGIDYFNQARNERSEDIQNFIAKIQENQQNNIHIDNKLRDEQNSFAEEKMKLEAKKEEYTQTSQQVTNIIESSKDGYHNLTLEQINKIEKDKKQSEAVIEKIFKPFPGASSHELLSSISNNNK